MVGGKESVWRVEVDIVAAVVDEAGNAASRFGGQARARSPKFLTISL